ncbi:MAG: flagellar biosynthesis protein FlhF [Spirochaetales bacterium]|nr:flagellar biosynthesis protein FlhF [Spirochaetales bacterium]
MQYFTETALTHGEVLEKIRLKHGDKAKILTHRTVRIGGFLGLFARDGVEITGYIAQESRRNRVQDIEQEKQKILNSVKKDQTLQQVLKEVQCIKQTLDNAPAEESERHQTLATIEDQLSKNDFTIGYIRRIILRIKRHFSLEELDNYELVQRKVVDWIAETIQLNRVSFLKKPKIIVLVGPTGVGKTTTIAKLAAIHGIGSNGDRPKTVRMITIDNYRIGAKQQIETYGDIMGIPVSCVETFDELKKMIVLFQDVELVLIDTIGKSPRDYMKLAEMRELLDACGSEAEIYLAVSATTKTADLLEVFQQFEPFKYSSLVLTKLDETMHIGNIISALAEKNRPIAFITDGQVVPQDIEKASVTSMLMHLDGFRVDQERISRVFDGGAETTAPIR